MVSHRRPLPFLAIALVNAACLLAACTPGPPGPPHEPSVAEFSPGTCREAAPALIAIDRLVHKVRDEHVTPKSIGKPLAAAQRQLSVLPAGSDPTADKLLADLVLKIGLLRLSIDTDNYQRVRLDRVGSLQQSVVAHCTHKGPKSGG